MPSAGVAPRTHLWDEVLVSDKDHQRCLWLRRHRQRSDDRHRLRQIPRLVDVEIGGQEWPSLLGLAPRIRVLSKAQRTDCRVGQRSDRDTVHVYRPARPKRAPLASRQAPNQFLESRHEPTMRVGPAQHRLR